MIHVALPGFTVLNCVYETLWVLLSALNIMNKAWIIKWNILFLNTVLALTEREWKTDKWAEKQDYGDCPCAPLSGSGFPDLKTSAIQAGHLS